MHTAHTEQNGISIRSSLHRIRNVEVFVGCQRKSLASCSSVVHSIEICGCGIERVEESGIEIAAKLQKNTTAHHHHHHHHGFRATKLFENRIKLMLREKTQPSGKFHSGIFFFSILHFHHVDIRAQSSSTSHNSRFGFLRVFALLFFLGWFFPHLFRCLVVGSTVHLRRFVVAAVLRELSFHLFTRDFPELRRASIRLLLFLPWAATESLATWMHCRWRTFAQPFAMNRRCRQRRREQK